jgi:hypothetical protein
MKRPRTFDRKYRRPVFDCYLLWLACLSSTVTAFVPIIITPSSSSFRQPQPTSLSASSSIGGAVVAASSSLSSLTVKELRDLVKQNSLNERGLLSRLKRKQDLISFLTNSNDDTEAPQMEPLLERVERMPVVLAHDIPESNDQPLIHDSSESSETLLLEELPAEQIPTTAKRRPTRLPPLAQPSSPTGSENTGLSPKDAIFRDVFARYPPVQVETAAAALALANAATQDDVEIDETGTSNDVRQLYHPMLQACRQEANSSDMDIVFVGTASCTPGTTRGVSCTALRLNWKRRTTVGMLSEQVNGGLSKPSVPQAPQSFQGGTWLFDVGECTQVS